MFTIIDFETDGLYGPIIELAAVNEKREVLSNLTNLNSLRTQDIDNDENKYSETIHKFFKDITETGNIIVFWHNFMPLYLQKYYPEILNSMKGRFVLFTDFYAIFDGIRQPRYKIADITYDLTGRDHKGNALDDALDLYDCFKITQ